MDDENPGTRPRWGKLAKWGAWCGLTWGLMSSILVVERRTELIAITVAPLCGAIAVQLVAGVLARLPGTLHLLAVCTILGLFASVAVAPVSGILMVGVPVLTFVAPMATGSLFVRFFCPRARHIARVLVAAAGAGMCIMGLILTINRSAGLPGEAVFFFLFTARPAGLAAVPPLQWCGVPDGTDGDH